MSSSSSFSFESMPTDPISVPPTIVPLPASKDVSQTGSPIASLPKKQLGSPPVPREICKNINAIIERRQSTWKEVVARTVLIALVVGLGIGAFGGAAIIIQALGVIMGFSIIAGTAALCIAVLVRESAKRKSDIGDLVRDMEIFVINLKAKMKTQHNTHSISRSALNLAEIERDERFIKNLNHLIEAVKNEAAIFKVAADTKKPLSPAQIQRLFQEVALRGLEQS